MSSGKLWPRIPLLLCVLYTHRSLYSAASAKEQRREGWNTALEEFFGSIDKDGDGQIETAEALQYINANFDPSDINQDSRRAAQQMSKNLDGSDSDVTISKEEVENHLRKLLKGNRVTEWLKHSAQMPQYAQAFRGNAITSLDFPMLVADGGLTLEIDLGVRSKLHREQLLRALKRVILGLGVPPSSPQELLCKPLACDAFALRWQPPEKLGQPPMHKYKLERQQTKLLQESIAAPSWETANGDLDDEEVTWVDSGLEVGTYSYRLTAWNVLGWSEYAFSTECDSANTSLPCPPEKCWDASACLREPGSPQAALQAEGSAASREASVAWKLLWSFLGVGVVGLVSARFLTTCQRTSLQETLEIGAGHNVLRLLGLSQFARVLMGGPTPSKTSEEGSGEMDDGQQAELLSSGRQGSIADQLEGVTHSISGEVPPSSRVQSLRQLQHNDSGNSRSSIRDGYSGGSTPTRKPHHPITRSDCFFPQEVEQYRGLSEQQMGGPMPSLRATRRDSNTLVAEQEVLWLDDEGVEVNAPPVLEIPSSPHQASRYGCAFPSCEKSLHPLFNPRSAMTSHYCSICQNVFCHRHTRYSPHGKLGSCGMESKCICQICYDDLPRHTQERLEKTNRLQRTKKDLLPSPSGGSGTNRERLERSEKSRRAMLFGMTRHGSTGSAASDASLGKSSPTALVEAPTNSGGVSLTTYTVQHSSGAHNWGRLRTAWQAVMRFKGAGRDRQRRSIDELSGRAPPISFG